VERILAWLTARRLARDYERHPATSEAMIRWAAINTMLAASLAVDPAPGPGHGHSNTNETNFSNIHQGRCTCGTGILARC
jgi:hypothetical protein